MILVGVLGVAFEACILFVDRPWWDARALRFAGTPEFALYVAVACANVASQAMASVFVVKEIRGVWKYRTGEGRQILGSFALLLALTVAVLALLHAQLPDYPLPHYRVKLNTITVLATALAAMAVTGIWLVQAAFERTFEDRGPPTAAQIARFVDLRDRMQLLLTCLGLILGGAILNAGALRQAILADNHTAALPAEVVLLYGGAVSALVALAYTPAHLRVLSIGRQMRDRCFPIPSPVGAPWAAWHADRKAFEELLGLQVSASASLRTGASILTPLASGIVSLLLGGTG